MNNIEQSIVDKYPTLFKFIHEEFFRVGRMNSRSDTSDYETYIQLYAMKYNVEEKRTTTLWSIQGWYDGDEIQFHIGDVVEDEPIYGDEYVIRVTKERIDK